MLLLVLLVLLLVLLLVPDWIPLMPELRKRRWRSGKESEAEQEKSRHGYYPCVDDNDDDPDWMNGPDGNDSDDYWDEDRAWEAMLEAQEREAQQLIQEARVALGFAELEAQQLSECEAQQLIHEARNVDRHYWEEELRRLGLLAPSVKRARV